MLSQGRSAGWAARRRSPAAAPPPSIEEVRQMFEKFGAVLDVYLPRDYYNQ